MIIQTISIKSVTAQGMGTLSVFEGSHDVPFDIKRIYYIHGAPKGTHRGGHAHKALRQVLWCPYGSIRIRLDNGREKADVLLDSPDKGLIVEHYMWREMIWEKKDSVLCVAADSYYDESDYIRDYDEFLEAVKGKDLTDAVDGTPLHPGGRGRVGPLCHARKRQRHVFADPQLLNYHPAGRFTDASLMVYNEHGGLGAVVPAALRLDGATRIFRSHPGSTFGGPVLRSTYNSAAKSIGILQAVEDYIATRYDAADFRPTPDLFNGVENVALQYAFTYLGYTQQTELSTWVPVAGRTPETLLASFRQNKSRM